MEKQENSPRLVKKQANIPHRLYLLFFIIVTLFVLLILRLAQMQIKDKAFYDDKLKSSTTYQVKSSNPRGMIFDQTGKLLVGNETKDVVSYTRLPNTSAKDIKNLANLLKDYMTLKTATVSERAKKDYFLADSENYLKIYKSLPKKEKYDSYGNQLAESVIYNNVVNAVDSAQLNYSQEEEQVIAIFNQMNSVANFNSVTLKSETLSNDQIALLIAKKSDLPGITVKTDWDRKVEDTSLSSIIGKVSSREAGLPQEEAEAYLEKGYALNDRVGTSYLEKEYETQLQGKRDVREIKTNKNGKVISEKVIEKGANGKNLKLTISTDYQNGVKKILNQYFQSELAAGNANYSEGVYAVAMNPKTGAILAMAGIDRDLESGQLQDNALGTITNVFTPGSVVKGATLAAGWKDGVISGNQVLTDQPIQFGNSKPINSWFTSGQQNINAVQALEYSSNTYMVQIALKMMGQDYHVGMSLMTEGTKSTMEKLRKTFAEYGLGSATGIDLPGESTGYLPKDFTASNVLTEAFGQFDNYTTLQLAQYVSTIANNGNRLAPHIVDSIYDNDGSKGLGKNGQALAIKSLNQVQLTPEQLAIVQNGFYQVVNSGSPYATGKGLAGSAVTISAKTGTAETYAKDKNGSTVSTFNLNVVAYGPSQDPQIAVAIMYPHSTDALAKAHQYMARDMINLYMSNNH